MIKKINFYLDNLSSREKIFCAILSCVLALFIALKFIYPLLEKKFLYENEQNINLDILQEKQEANFITQTRINTLLQKQKEQEKKLNELDLIMHIFKYKYKDYLNELYRISNFHTLHFTNLKTKKQAEEKLNIYTISFELETDFFKLLAFLQDIKNSNLKFQIKELIIVQNQNEIKSAIVLHFIELH